MSGTMCLKGSRSPSILLEAHPNPPPFRSGVRKQCRLLGQTAHQAFVKAGLHVHSTSILLTILIFHTHRNKLDALFFTKFAVVLE
jgi:hypothetical protein